MLVCGCSHAAGSEIDGTQDSEYNRQNSFGNLVAKNLGYTPVNISQVGFTNSGIARSVIEYTLTQNKPDFVLVAWTDSIRVEAPYYRSSDYENSNPAIDWFDKSCKDYLRISMLNTVIAAEEEREQILDFQSFTIRNEYYTEINNMLHILNLQSFLKLQQIPYMMVNTNYMLQKMHSTIRWYFKLIDRVRYPNFDDNTVNFYPKYKNLGYSNPKAKYFHHGIDAHLDYSNYITTYINENKLTENI